jgi:hypothetical protein
MAAARVTTQMEAVIGENTNMTRDKDMEHSSMVVEADTLGNRRRMSNTAMEYTDGQMEEYTMDNGNKVNRMVMDTTGG